MKANLRACLLLMVCAFGLSSAVAEESAQTPLAFPDGGAAISPQSPTVRRALPVSRFQPPPADAQPPATETQPTQSPTQQAPLQDIPTTTVVAQSGGAGAQGNAAPGNTVVETPTRTGIALSDFGGSVSVVTAEQIQQRNIISVVDALRALPGVDVVQGGGPGRVASVFIRGADAAQTKVLLDGIWMNDPISPARGFDFSTLSIDNIERIEVLRGPQSALYGSDAIGGVINIITKRGQGPLSARGTLYGGSFGTSRESMNASGGNQYAHYSFGASYLDTRNISSADSRLPGNGERDPFYLGTIAGRVGVTPFENLEAQLIFRYNHADAKIDNQDINGLNGAFQDDPNAKNVANQVYSRAVLRYITPNEFWEQKLSFNTTNSLRQSLNPTDTLHPLDSFFARYAGQTQFTDWQHNFFLHRTNTLTAGVSYIQENGDSSFVGLFAGFPFFGDQPRRKLTDTAFYLQDQIRLFDRWFTTIGVRQDNYSLAGLANTYRFTTLYRVPITETALRGSIGTGFKAPTLFQLFDAFLGNPGLRPEEAKGWDFGFDQPLFDRRLDLFWTYFRQDYTNLIEFRPTGPFTGNYFNVGRARSDGVELGGSWNMNDVTTLTLNYTALQALNLDTNTRLLRRPQDRIGLTANRKLLDNRANANLTAWYVGNRVDQDFTSFNAHLVRLPSYFVLNLAGSYDIRSNWQVFGRIDNLLNKHYQEIFGLGTAPISAFVGTTLSR